MSSCNGNCSECGSDCADRKPERLLAELRDAGFERCEVVERDEPFEDMPGVCQIVVAARVPTGAR